MPRRQNRNVGAGMPAARAAVANQGPPPATAPPPPIEPLLAAVGTKQGERLRRNWDGYGENVPSSEAPAAVRALSCLPNGQRPCIKVGIRPSQAEQFATAVNAQTYKASRHRPARTSERTSRSSREQVCASIMPVKHQAGHDKAVKWFVAELLSQEFKVPRKRGHRARTTAHTGGRRPSSGGRRAAPRKHV